MYYVKFQLQWYLFNISYFEARRIDMIWKYSFFCPIVEQLTVIIDWGWAKCCDKFVSGKQINYLICETLTNVLSQYFAIFSSEQSIDLIMCTSSVHGWVSSDTFDQPAIYPPLTSGSILCQYSIYTQLISQLTLGQCSIKSQQIVNGCHLTHASIET